MAEHSTVKDFLAQLPAERRKEMTRVRAVVRRHLPKGYEEVVGSRMLVYQVPKAQYPDTYNKQPLWYAALASEKSYLSLHLMPVYGDAALAKRLADGFREAGKTLNMGKACLRFAKADDLALDVVGDIVAAVPMDRWIALAKAARKKPAPGKTSAAPTTRAATATPAKAPMAPPAPAKHRVYTTSVASVYPHYVTKAEKKGRTKAEVDEIIRWLTGYTQAAFEKRLGDKTDFETFFADAPKMNPARSLVTGVVCGVRIEDITEPTMREIRYLDKLIDELAKGRPMAKILRTAPARPRPDR